MYWSGYAWYPSSTQLRSEATFVYFVKYTPPCRPKKQKKQGCHKKIKCCWHPRFFYNLMYICLATHLILVCGALQFENVIGHLVIHAAWHHQIHREPEGKCCMAGFRFFSFFGLKDVNAWMCQICLISEVPKSAFSASSVIQQQYKKKKKLKKVNTFTNVWSINWR